MFISLAACRSDFLGEWSGSFPSVVGLVKAGSLSEVFFKEKETKTKGWKIKIDISWKWAIGWPIKLEIQKHQFLKTKSID